MDDTIKCQIETGLPGAKVVMSGEGCAIQAEIEYAGFAGKNLIEQHRMVYEVLGPQVGKELHAISLITRTPEE